MRRFGLLVFSLVLTSSVQAQWVYDNIRDEMRSLDREMAVLKSKSDGLTASLVIFDLKASGLNALISIDGDSIQCPSNSCELSARFDNGRILELLAQSNDERKSIAPLDAGAFAGAVALSKELIVELPLRSSGKVQFKFPTSGLKFSPAPIPAKAMFGIPWGSAASSLKAASTPVPKDGGVVCYEVSDLRSLPNTDVDGKGSFCFFNDKFYSVLVSSKNSKANRAKLVKLADVEFGPVDREVATYLSWPKSSGRAAKLRNTTGAMFVRDGAGQTDSSIFVYSPIDYMTQLVKR